MRETTDIQEVMRIAKEIEACGGTAYYVGGYVRDKYMGKESKDIDVEVHGITSLELEEILGKFGKVEEVGKQYGVYLVKGLDVDISLYDTKQENENVSVAEAARRRDFTMNAIMENILTGEVLDPFQGVSDIKQGIIRHVDIESFKEDPLRVYRMAQFAARFEYSVAEETLELCREVGVTELPVERVEEEFKKGLLKSERPSEFIRLLNEVDILDRVFPEIRALIGCEQHKEYHPEGDVFTHTMMVLDEAAKLRDKVEKPFPFMLGALFHDIGKPLTVSFEGDKITTHGHDVKGATKVGRILKRTLTREKDVIKYVSLMVKNHMRPRWLYPRASAKAFRKMAKEMDGHIEDLFYLVEADTLGRGGVVPGEFDKYKEFFEERMDSLKLKEEYKPVVTGNDLIERGLIPGKEFTVLLNKALDLQMEGKSKQEILLEIL